MFMLIWVTLLFSVRGSNADTGASVGGRTYCQSEFCVTLNEEEITAEAGLCVVIPCSFTVPFSFRPQHVVWSKCEPSQQRCDDSDMIFHSNKNNRKVQSGFRGRVSLLDPDMRNNCSIIINDLAESDSGSYQLRVNGYQYGRPDGFTFSPRATVSVKDLIQKPTVMIPPLTEGQQTTLTCTAPGLCSGSAPEITWTWRGRGENDSHITGNITDFMTESVTAVTQRHSSTLTFNPSAEHHSTEVTCKVSFMNSITTEETVTLNVTYVKEVKITGNTRMKEGETLNLTCSVESFPPSLITWTKFSDKNMQNGTETDVQTNNLTDVQNDTFTDLQNDTFTDLQNNTETYLQEESRMGTYSISNITAGDSGQYICTAKHLNNTLEAKVNVTVVYMKQPVITGATTVVEQHTLNLTCGVESFPPSRITWTKLGSNTNLHNGPDADLQDDTGSATLVIHNVKEEHSGLYICTVKYLNTTVAVYADVAVILIPTIQNSGCQVRSEVLTCMCISEGIPLPTIKWPLLENYTEYSVMTAISNHTVNSTITLTVKDLSNTAVECLSNNKNGEAKENLNIQKDVSKQKADQSKEVLNVSWMEVIIAFFVGVLFSAVICCLVIKCHRKKMKSSGNLDKPVEMVTCQRNPLVDLAEKTLSGSSQII